MAAAVMFEDPFTRSRVVIARGARAAERCLLTEVEGLLGSNDGPLAPPIRIVVPSTSLRTHLLRELVRERGAVAGVLVQTLFGTAMEVLERSGAPRPRGDAGFEVLVRRLASDGMKTMGYRSR